MRFLPNFTKSKCTPPNKFHNKNRRNYFLQWIFLPLIIASLSEAFAYKIKAGNKVWFSSQEKQVSEVRSVDIISFGSSRVNAAVDLMQLTELVSEQTNNSLNSINLARGNVSFIHSYLALKRLLEKHPEKLENAVILLEIPDGLPPIYGTWANTPDGWNGKWTEVDKNPQFLSATLSDSDAKKLWQSDTDVEAKLILSVRWVTQRSHLLSGKEYIKKKITTTVKKIPKKIVPEKLVIKSQETSDVALKGGTITEQRRFTKLNRLMEKSSARMLQDQQSFNTWDYSVITDFFQLAKKNNLRVVLYHMPQSLHFEAAFTTAMRDQDRITFAEMAESWNATIIKPDWSSESGDFPDGLHLAKSRRSDFTEELANQLIMWWQEERKDDF